MENYLTNQLSEGEGLKLEYKRCQVPEKLNVKVRVNKGQSASHYL